MSWNGFDPIWSKEFKDYAFYCIRDSDMAGLASEWLYDLYCCHESMYEESWFPTETEADIELYSLHLTSLIKKSKELKMIRKFLRDMGEAHGVNYMKDFRKAMRKNYGVVIE